MYIFKTLRKSAVKTHSRDIVTWLKYRSVIFETQLNTNIELEFSDSHRMFLNVPCNVVISFSSYDIFVLRRDKTRIPRIKIRPKTSKPLQIITFPEIPLPQPNPTQHITPYKQWRTKHRLRDGTSSTIFRATEGVG